MSDEDEYHVSSGPTLGLGARLRACWLILSATPVEIRIRMQGSEPW